MFASAEGPKPTKMSATKNDTKRALNLKRSRDAIVRHITQNAQSWAKLQKEHTILKRENCGGVLYKENSWLDELKPEYETAPLSDFSALIQAIDINLENATKGPNSRGSGVEVVATIVQTQRARFNSRDLARNHQKAQKVGHTKRIGNVIYRQWVNAEAKKVNGPN